MLLASAGAALAIAGAGLALAPSVAAVLSAWLLIGGVTGAAARLALRAGRHAAAPAVGRLVALQVARMVDADADLKVIHAKASMAKLFVSEAAWRCADRAVQVFGGRGYLRSNVAERFLRELRVDRIWEGTSEIQRLIIARALERRGVERVIH